MTPRRPLVVFAAGSLRPAFNVLAAVEPQSVELHYANARDLAARIVAGEPADVFASASLEHPRALHAAGVVDEPRQFASNRLVVAVPMASPAHSPSVIAEPGTRLVIEVQGIPLGDYTRELLARMDALAGDGFAERAFANVVAEEQTVDAVAARLLDGEGDAAVLYATDVAARRERLRALDLPSRAAVEVRCFASVVASSSAPDRAAAWTRALTAAPAAGVLEWAGFGPPRPSAQPSAR